MPRKATQSFMSYVGGVRRMFIKGQVVPDEIADRVLALTYDDTPPPPNQGQTVGPRKRTAKRAAKSDD